MTAEIDIEEIVANSKRLAEQVGELLTESNKPLSPLMLRNIREAVYALEKAEKSAPDSRTASKLKRPLQEWVFFLINNGLSADADDPLRCMQDIGNRTSAISSAFESAGREVQGLALRDSVSKTTRIRVDRIVEHGTTGKRIRRSKNFMVHDEFNRVRKGDLVTARECPPHSKNKSFEVTKINGRNVLDYIIPKND